MNLGQQARVKYAEDGLTGSQAKTFFFYFRKNYHDHMIF